MKHKIHFMVMIMSIILMPLYAEVLSIKKDVQSNELNEFLEKYSDLKEEPKVLSLLIQGESEAIDNGMKAKDFYKYLGFAHSKLTNRTHKKLAKYTPAFLDEFEHAYIGDNSIEFGGLTEYFKAKQKTKAAVQKTKAAVQKTKAAVQKTKAAEQFLELSKSL